MNFFQALDICFIKYATFAGRASRNEYWWFFLFTFVGGFCFYFLVFYWTVVVLPDEILLHPASILIEYSFYIFFAAVLLPHVAVGCRRLHDIGLSGWWQLIIVFPLIGHLTLLIMFMLPTSDAGDKYIATNATDMRDVIRNLRKKMSKVRIRSLQNVKLHNVESRDDT